MRAWLLMLGGLIVWAVHFFALYILASIFGTTMTARLGTAVLTLACLAADGAILAATLPALRGDQAADLDRWIRGAGAVGAGLSLVAVAWQGLPALIA